MADFIQKLIDNIPDYQQFLTVDEMDENSKRLAAEFPGIVEIFAEAGKSRKGHPIYCLEDWQRQPQRFDVRLSASQRTDGRNAAGVFFTGAGRR